MNSKILRTGVAMCVYNGARFLQEQLDSIAGQTQLPARMAIVDDGSLDDSWDMLQRWAATAPFEVLLHRNDSNVGVVLNFERAISLLGEDIEIVFLADQDDRWFPGKVETFTGHFATDPALALLHSDADLIDGNGKRLGRRLFETLLVTDDERSDVQAGRAWRVYTKRNLVTGAACAFRRALLAHALPFSPRWIHDEWLAFAAALSGKVTLLDEPTMAYRLHQSNTVGMPIPTFWWRLRTTRDALLSPTAPRQRLRAERLEEIALRAELLYAGAEVQEHLKAALAHANFRGHLPRNPLRRLKGVLHEWRLGHYHRWSNGEMSFFHDLLVPR